MARHPSRYARPGLRPGVYIWLEVACARRRDTELGGEDLLAVLDVGVFEVVKWLLFRR